jgi:hypothetical protein
MQLLCEFKRELEVSNWKLSCLERLREADSCLGEGGLVVSWTWNHSKRALAPQVRKLMCRAWDRNLRRASSPLSNARGVVPRSSAPTPDCEDTCMHGTKFSFCLLILISPWSSNTQARKDARGFLIESVRGTLPSFAIGENDSGGKRELVWMHHGVALYPH